VDEHGDAAYGDAAVWQHAAERAMRTLLDLLADALPELLAR
jgi:hypothetical protein